MKKVKKVKSLFALSLLKSTIVNIINDNGIQLFDEEYLDKQKINELSIHLYSNNDFESERMGKFIQVLRKFNILSKLKLVIGVEINLEPNSLILLGKYFSSHSSLLDISIFLNGNLNFNNEQFIKVQKYVFNQQYFGESSQQGQPNQYNEEGLSYLFESLKSLKQLIHFKIHIGEGIRLSYQSMKQLSLTINQLTKLNSLQIFISLMNDLGQQGGYELGESLKNISDLITLSIVIGDKNCIGEIGMNSLFNNLSQLYLLKNLKLIIGKGNSLTTKSIFMLCTSFKQMSQLQNLQLQIYDEIDSTAIQYLYKGIVSLTSLNSLYFRLQNDKQLQIFPLIQELKSIKPNMMCLHSPMILKYGFNKTSQKINSVNIRIFEKNQMYDEHYKLDDNDEEIYSHVPLTLDKSLSFERFSNILLGLQDLDQLEELHLEINLFQVQNVWVEQINDLYGRLLNLRHLFIELYNCQISRNQINSLGNNFQSLKKLRFFYINIQCSEDILDNFDAMSDKDSNQFKIIEQKGEDSNIVPYSLEEKIKQLQSLESLFLRFVDKEERDQVNYLQLAQSMKQIKQLNSLELKMSILEVDCQNIQPLKESMETIRKFGLQINLNQIISINPMIGDLLSQSLNLQSISLNLNVKHQIKYISQKRIARSNISKILKEVCDSLMFIPLLTSIHITFHKLSLKRKKLFEQKQSLIFFPKCLHLTNFMRKLKRLTIIRVD